MFKILNISLQMVSKIGLFLLVHNTFVGEAKKFHDVGLYTLRRGKESWKVLSSYICENIQIFGQP